MKKLPVIYLAGKITMNDWRDAIVNHITDGMSRIPNLPLDYKVCGPEFVGWTHGCHHHSKATRDKPDRANFSRPEHMRDEIPAFCRAQMRRATAIFAWIDCHDCFGTLVELGWAQEAGLPVYIAYATPALAEAMWFVARGARTWSGVHSTAIGGLRRALELYAEVQLSHLPLYPRETNLTTHHNRSWK